MNRFYRLPVLLALAAAVALTLAPTSAWAQSKPLNEEDLRSLFRLGIDDEAVVDRIQKA